MKRVVGVASASSSPASSRKTGAAETLSHHRPSLLTLPHRNLLRATVIGTVLRSWGGVLGNSAGSAETFELSKPCDHIHTFISHNWAVPRRIKFLTLALHFNADCALCVSSTILLLTVALTSIGILPRVKVYNLFVGHFTNGVLCLPLGCLGLTYRSLDGTR